MDRKRIKEADFPKFLKQEYPNDPPWKGFFKLWLDARGFDYGEQDQNIVDGFGDGGIDAIAYPPHGHTELPIVVIQSKYYRSAIPTKSLHAFLTAVEAFRSNSRADFDKWLQKVKRKSLKTVYIDLWRHRRNIRFVIVTASTIPTESASHARKLKIKVEDKKHINAIFFDMAYGKSPRPERIKLKKISNLLTIKKTNDHALFVLAAPLNDFAKAYQNEKENLFAGNVRYALPGKTEVKVGISTTLKNRPEEFAYFHNGITIVCKKVQVKGNHIFLHSPSIVNGAQTVSFIGESLSGNIDPNASVIIKIIEVTKDSGFEEFETDVAMSSNTQNKVSLSDLSVTDPDLVSLDRFFIASKCFLVRKKGAGTLGTVIVTITKDRLLQLFTSLDPNGGPAVTKDVQALYKNYSARLFEYYAQSLERKRDAVFLAKLDKFIKASLKKFKLSGKKGKRKKNRLSLSYFTIFALIVYLIKDKSMWRELRSAFNSDGIMDNQYALVLDKDVRMVAAAVLAKAKTDLERNDTAFFKNKEKVAEVIKCLRRRLRHNVRFHT